MLIIFVSILAALGAAFAFRGKAARGLLIITVALAADLAAAVATERWNWTAFLAAMLLISVGGIVAARTGDQ
jgi:hypothetical protein